MTGKFSYLAAVIVLALSGVSAITMLAILRPENTSTGTVIVGIVVPIITVLLAAAQRELHVAVNSRLTELLDATRASGLAEGRLSARDAEDKRTAQIASTLKDVHGN